MQLVAIIVVCGLAVPVPECRPETSLMWFERTSFPQSWCVDDPNAGSTSAQISRTGTYEKILCDLREPPPVEPIDLTDEDLTRGGPR
jgi:hypothetical protein